MKQHLRLAIHIAAIVLAILWCFGYPTEPQLALLVVIDSFLLSLQPKTDT